MFKTEAKLALNIHQLRSLLLLLPFPPPPCVAPPVKVIKSECIDDLDERRLLELEAAGEVTGIGLEVRDNESVELE